MAPFASPKGGVLVQSPNEIRIESDTADQQKRRSRYSNYSRQRNFFFGKDITLKDSQAVNLNGEVHYDKGGNKPVKVVGEPYDPLDEIKTLAIVSYPNYYRMPIGTQVRFVIETKNGEPLPEGLKYQWQCINDPATVRSSTSSRFRGPNQPEWNNALWSVAGRHTILLTIHNPSTGAVKRIDYPQIVDHTANIMNAQLGKKIE